MSCTYPGCNFGDDGGGFQTDDVEGSVALEILKMHREDAHRGQAHQQPQGQAETRQSAPRGKIDMPSLTANCTSEQWEDFLYDWKNYKKAMGITDNIASAYLYGCLEDELRKDLRKSNTSVVASDMTELDLLKAVKKLTVKEESILAHRIKLGKAVQAP